ncbi:hypothetical protein [Altererythrobacter sp. ZODW24]|uniref:hypothetical protein n=1 Tax=Altererythrobacter sp. ZODW24 TaxID=2185142 RepID=UPI001F07C382|nr:hypothetical protein [Altererythrobacter sp. ZODW24]
MAKIGKMAKRSGFSARLLLAGAAIGLAIPGTGLAIVGNGDAPSFVQSSLASFTPAGVDPALARRVASRFDGKDTLRFTPAGSGNDNDRAATVAVRVDDQTARAISVRSAINVARGEAGVGQPIGEVRIAPTRYSLGASRGYKSFAKPFTLSNQVSDIAMPDLATFEPGQGTVEKKPSRFGADIQLENERNVGRAPSTLEGLGDQAVDVSGSFRVAKNLNVTAGVRVSQERDRIAPLTDATQDSQAVYVGTRFKF